MEFDLFQRYGVKVHVNEDADLDFDLPTAIDAETDEKDNFVGFALCQSHTDVYYFTRPPSLVHLEKFKHLIGHNIKADLHWFWQWGAQIPVENVLADTMLMSYVMDATKDSHGLKQIAVELLNWHWPHYRDIVGKGKGKLTLDKQPVVRVANYCGADAAATFKIYCILMRRMNPMHQRAFSLLEMPIMRLLFRMEKHGLLIDRELLEKLNVQFTAELAGYEATLRGIAGSEMFNPRSPKQVLDVCKLLGFNPIDRDKKTHQMKASSSKKALTPYAEKPFVATLFSHRQVAKLHSSYILRMGEATTLPWVYPEFSQVSVDEAADEWNGIRTGRLSSDYHNIPRRSAKGKLLRGLFVAPEGQEIICGDYSQIEYRLLAHFTKEPMLLAAFRNGQDVHEETAKMFGSSDRDTGKTLNFAAVYGAQARKISETAKMSEAEAQRLLDIYWTSLKQVTSWIARVKYEAKMKRGVRTIFGRFIPLPGLAALNPYERMHAERQAVNYTIQGSAADIIKLAMVECDKQGFFPILQVHDELLFNVNVNKVQEYLPRIQAIVENVVKLDVPLLADFHHGKSWAEAKS